MSNTDKWIRLLVAGVIAALFFGKIISGIVAIVLAVVAGIFLLTSLVNVCPLYSVLGISTCPVNPEEGA